MTLSSWLRRLREDAGFALVLGGTTFKLRENHPLPRRVLVPFARISPEVGLALIEIAEAAKEHEEAKRSAVRMLLDRYKHAPCDSGAVSTCVRCTTVATARWLSQALDALSRLQALAEREASG